MVINQQNLDSLYHGYSAAFNLSLIHISRLIIMDEPTVAVDPQSRNKILEGIQKLNEQGSTIIYTSHYMEEVEQICTQIAIMDHGHVIASGTKEDLKKMIKTGETITIEAVSYTHLGSTCTKLVIKSPAVPVSRIPVRALLSV